MAQLASASGLGPEGPVFESQYPDKRDQSLLTLVSFLCLLTSERGPFLVPSAVEGAVEGAAGANKERGGRFAH